MLPLPDPPNPYQARASQRREFVSRRIGHQQPGVAALSVWAI
jgi:hypothetical protein